MALGEQGLTEMGTDETGATRDQTSHFSLSKIDPVRIETVLCNVIEAVPVVSGYSSARKQFYIDDAFLRGIDYFDKTGTLVKEYRVIDTMLIDGQIYPKECIMRTMSDNSYTILIFNSIELVDSIPSRIFNRANL